jgi:MFS family permease
MAAERDDLELMGKETEDEISVVVAVPDPFWAKVTLALCCTSYVCSSVGADAVRVLQLSFREVFSDFEIGVLYGSYALAATLIVLFSGGLIDRVGPRKSTMVFSALAVVGFTLQGAGTLWTNFGLLLVGRFVHGAGAEALFVCWDTFVTLSFTAQGIGLAMSLYCASGRLGDVVASTLLPLLNSVMSNRAQVMAMAFACVLASFACNVGLVLVDYYKRAAPKTPSGAAATQAFSVAALKEFSPGYWICCGVATFVSQFVSPLFALLTFHSCTE